MAGAEEAKFTGMAKYFNSYTMTGRANVSTVAFRGLGRGSPALVDMAGHPVTVGLSRSNFGYRAFRGSREERVCTPVSRYICDGFLTGLFVVV